MAERVIFFDGLCNLCSFWVKEGRYFTQSTASLRILRQLTGLWPLRVVFIKEESCFVPAPEIRSRFL